MLFCLKILFVILIFCETTIIAGTIDPSTPDSKYVDYGSKFECVVPISGMCDCNKRPEPHAYHASAVVIKPNWIVTAAHVVKGTRDVKIKIKEKEFEIKKIIINKDFSEDNLGYHDIALGYCESEFGLNFYPELYKENDELSKVVSMCGYGMTGTFSTGIKYSDGKKRAGSNIIERIERNCLICTNSGGKKTELEFMIGSGDSGGGLFLNQKLAGINSFVMADDGSPNSNYGDECGHTRVSLYVPWIERVIKLGEDKED